MAKYTNIFCQFANLFFLSTIRSSKIIYIFLSIIFAVESISSDHSYVVGIYEKSEDGNLKHVCDEALIHPEWVITSQNCLKENEQFSPGSYYVLARNPFNRTARRMTKAWMAESIDPVAAKDTIALLHLEYLLEGDNKFRTVGVASASAIEIKHPRDVYRMCVWKSWTEGGSGSQVIINEVSRRRCEDIDIKLLSTLICSSVVNESTVGKMGGPLICGSVETAVYTSKITDQKGTARLVFSKVDPPFVY